MLEQLLKYHQSLLPDEFVQKLLARIAQQHQTRQLVLGIFMLLGLLAGGFGLLELSSLNWYQSYNDLLGNSNLATVSLGLIMVGFVSFIIWLFNDEAELF